MSVEVNFSNPKTLTADQVIQYLTQIAKDSPEPKTNRAVIYVRKSRVISGISYYSPEIQEKDCRDLAARNQLEVQKVITDLDRSGKNSDRPGLQEILLMARNREIDFVLVQYIDRNYRNGLSMLKFYEKLGEYGVSILSVHENINTKDFHGRFMLFMYSIMAEWPIHLTSERARATAQNLKEKGRHHGAYRLGYCNGLCAGCKDPNGYGYCPLFGGPNRMESDNGRIQVPHPIEKHAVVLIVNLYHSERSSREIARHLNDNLFQVDGVEVKFRTKGTAGYKEPGRFTSENVMDIVRNPFYVGVVAHYPTAKLDLQDDIDNPKKFRKTVKNRRVPEKTYAGNHQALYPYNLWEKNQSIRTSKKKVPANSVKSSRTYLLRGIAQCWECLPYTKPYKTVSLRGSVNGSGNAIYRCASLHGREKDKKSKLNFAQFDMLAKPDENAPNLRALHPKPILPAELLEKQVEDLVLNVRIPEEWYERILAYVASNEGLSEYKRMNYNLNAEFKKYKDMYSEGDIDSAEYTAKKMQISTELNNLKPSSNPILFPLLPVLKDFPALWSKLSQEGKHILLRVMFERIYFDGNGRIREVRAHAPFDAILNLRTDHE
jgi:DNA invertase Pin-like site-specific DNA recombinase